MNSGPAVGGTDPVAIRYGRETCGNLETAERLEWLVTNGSYLEPFVDHLRAAGVGSISEIVDGGPPHHADGCIAQAWSVAEVLRAWTTLRHAGAPAPM